MVRWVSSGEDWEVEERREREGGGGGRGVQYRYGDGDSNAPLERERERNRRQSLESGTLQLRRVNRHCSMFLNSWGLDNEKRREEEQEHELSFSCSKSEIGFLFSIE